MFLPLLVGVSVGLAVASSWRGLWLEEVLAGTAAGTFACLCVLAFQAMYGLVTRDRDATDC